MHNDEKAIYHKVVIFKSQLYSPPSAKKFPKLTIIPEAGEKECKSKKQVGLGNNNGKVNNDSSFSFEISQCDDTKSNAISFVNMLDIHKTGTINFNELVYSYLEYLTEFITF
jgi:hypothetical protein